MSESTVPSDEGTAEEYRRATDLERYGLRQKQFGLWQPFSISWTGSARELIREKAFDAWTTADPLGCVLRQFENHESVVKVWTVPQAQALYELITDELHHRRIDGRQRNSLHRVRDELEAAWDDQIEDLKDSTVHYNGHRFRAEGDFPEPSYTQDLALDDPPTHDAFVGGRFEYQLGDHASARPSNYEDHEVERVVDRLPLMYGYDAESV